MSSYVSQLVFSFVVFALGFAVESDVTLPMITTILAGTWYGCLYGCIIHRFPPWSASRQHGEGRLISATFRQLFSDLVDLRKKHPEAAKYLLALSILQNGLGTTVLTVSVSYLLEQLRISGMQNNILYLAILATGLGWGWVFRFLARKLSFRQLLLLIVADWIAFTAIISLAFVEPIDGKYNAYFLTMLVLGVVMVSPGLVWWYSVNWPAYMALIPASQLNQYAGIFTFVRLISLIPGPLIYTLLANAFHSASIGRRVGIASVGVWDVVAVPFILLIDFDRGMRHAGAVGAVGDNVVPDSTKGSVIGNPVTTEEKQ